MELSIVSTLYCSAPHLQEFYARCSAAAREITSDFELILVNDGSRDKSLDLALSFYEQDKKVRVIDLSRNFGHHKAMMTGLAHARGKLVFLIDCDLEVAPEVLKDFHHKMVHSDAEVVYGVQDTRKDPVTNRIAARLFYTTFNWLSTDPLPLNLVTARLMSQRYVKALVAHQEREMIIAGLWVITGFKQESMVVTKSHRGRSTYNLRRKIAHLVNSATSFSNRPLVLIFYMGSCISFLAGLAVAYLVIQRLFFGIMLTGWPSLIVSVWLLGGLTIFCVGILGVYLSKIFMETKQRPYTIIRQIYEEDQPV
jgi:putative glycosyltransferase